MHQPDISRGQSETAELKHTLIKLLSAMSLLSALGAAVVGTLAGVFLGPALAMGACFYTGNSEPVMPAAPYPWFTLLGIVAIGAAGHLLSRRPNREVLGHIILHFAAVAAALLPFLHIFNLWVIANAGPVAR